MSVAAASVVALGAGTSGVTAAYQDESGITFDRTVNIVDDLGADPTGGEPIDALLGGVEQEGTLVEFPAGEYRVDDTLDITTDRFGLRGAGDGQTRLVPPTGFREPLVEVRQQDDFLFRGIDIEGSGRSAPLIVHCRNRFHVEDVEFHGRGADSGYAFNLAIDNPDRTGILRDATVKHGSDPSAYNSGNGRIGIWIGLNHEGTVRVENCDLREFGNNGMYAGRTPGNVQVVDSYFLNNNVAAVRISGEGSYVENSVVEVDFRKYDGPLRAPENAFNCRGVVCDQKRGSSTTDQFPPKGGPVEIRDSTILMNHTPTSRRASQGAVSIWGTAQSCRVTNTKIEVNVDRVPAIHRESPGARGSFRADLEDPPTPHWVELDHVVVTGGAGDGAALDIEGADGTEITDSCIVQTGSNRDGASFVDTDNTAVTGTNISVSGEAIRTQNSTVQTTDITANEECSISVDGSTGGGGDGTDSGDEVSEPQYDHLLEVVSAADADTTTYEITVSGDADLVTDGEYSATAGTDTATANDDGTTTLAGIVGGGGGDSFRFDGDVLSGFIDGDATAYVDGDAVTLEPAGSDPGYDHLLEVVSAADADTTTYEVTVSGDADLVTDGEYSATAGTDTATANDDGTTTLAGIVGHGGGDSFRFDGDVLSGFIDGDATAYVDGDAVTLEPAELPDTLTVMGSSLGAASYQFGVSGYLRAKETDGAVTVESEDTVSGGSATGSVDGDTDVYAFSGDVSEFTLDGPAAVFVNDEQVDPDRLGTDADPVLPNRVVVSADDGSPSQYTFEVSGAIEKSPDLGSMEASDELSDQSVSGTIAEDLDGYRFSGDLTVSEIDGAMSIDLERTE